MLSPEELFALTKEALLLAAALSLPVVGAAFAAAVLSGILQSFSKITDPSLSTLPRMAVGLVALMAAAPWIGARATAFAERAWSLLQALHP